MLMVTCDADARLTMSKHTTKFANYSWNKRERRKVSEAPPFEVTGTHVVILVGALFTLAWLAGLLPDP